MKEGSRVQQTQYQRWQGRGEWVTDSVLGRIVGSHRRGATAGGPFRTWWVEWDDHYGDGWYPEDILIEIWE